MISKDILLVCVGESVWFHLCTGLCRLINQSDLICMQMIPRQQNEPRQRCSTDRVASANTWIGKGSAQFTLIRIIAGGGAITIWYHLACLEAVEALPTTETSVKSAYRPFTHLGALVIWLKLLWFWFFFNCSTVLKQWNSCQFPN